jgi:hypothetical protein
MKIFTKSLDELLINVIKSLDSEVEAFTPNDSIFDNPSSLEQTVKTMTEKYKIKSDFSLDFSNSQTDLVWIKVPLKYFPDREQILYNDRPNLDCHAINYTIPYKGNFNLLNYYVNKKEDIDLEVQLKNNFIIFQIQTKSYEPKLSEEEKKVVREKAVKIEGIINIKLKEIKEEIVKYNDSMNSVIEDLFEKREIKLAKDKNEKESLNPFR